VDERPGKSLLGFEKAGDGGEYIKELERRSFRQEYLSSTCILASATQS
jgi:hypothetical protein